MAVAEPCRARDRVKAVHPVPPPAVTVVPAGLLVVAGPHVAVAVEHAPGPHRVGGGVRVRSSVGPPVGRVAGLRLGRRPAPWSGNGSCTRTLWPGHGDTHVSGIARLVSSKIVTEHTATAEPKKKENNT